MLTGELEYLPVASLTLDDQNPRIPEDLIGASQIELLEWLEDEEVLTELALSMITNGFFVHEPLVVLQPEEKTQPFVVVEGNRRLSALMILLQLPTAKEARLEFPFQTPPSMEQLDRLREVPCYVVESRNEVRKFLGFRHIGGLKTWSPESKARYLESEIDDAISQGSSDPFREVARRTGSTSPAVRGQYLALKVLRAAGDLGIDARFVMRERFGVWNRLLNNPDVRSFIGLEEVTTVGEILEATQNVNQKNLRFVIENLTPPTPNARAVLSDSRDVTIYGKVLADDRARMSLQKLGDLSLARQIVERREIHAQLVNLRRTIESLTQDIDSYDLDKDVKLAAEALHNAARSLNGVIMVRVEEDIHD